MIFNFIEQLWFGKKTLTKTSLFTFLPILIYIYFIHYFDLEIKELSLLILLDIIGLLFSFFVLASIWRSSKNSNKIYMGLTRTVSILLIIYFLYMSYFKWFL
jgi:hypothetical protein